MENNFGGTDPRAAIILAGGDGTRLLSLTRVIAGRETPKQFCALDGKKTLLDCTLDRATLAASQPNTVIVVNRQHRQFYPPCLSEVPRECLIEQTGNRGTTPAILHATIRLKQKLGRDAIVTILPSDHYVDNDHAFIRHVEISARAVQQRPELMVILGIAPSYPEPAYGWIQPAEQIADSLDQAILRVRRFWEKPPPSQAERLWLGGCFWNSFVLTVKVGVLLDLIQTYLPDLYGSFSQVMNADTPHKEEIAATHAYTRIAASSFSDDVLMKAGRRLAVRPVNDLDWSDLGEPRRVYQALEAAGWDPPWLSKIRELGQHLGAASRPAALRPT